MLLPLAGAIVACAGDVPPAQDAGRSEDAGRAEPDASVDAEPEVEPDASMSTDSGLLDAAIDPLSTGWEGCPEARDYVGPGAGVQAIIASESALYCVQPIADGTLADQLQSKAVLRVAPGKYHLNVQQVARYRLPLCVRDAARCTLGEPGPLGFEGSMQERVLTSHYAVEHTLQCGARQTTLRTGLEVIMRAMRTPTLPLDGTYSALHAEQGMFDFTICEGEDCSRRFDACTLEGLPTHIHAVTLTDGELRLSLRIASEGQGRPASALVEATGTFRGQRFVQRDYFRLLYAPAADHTLRSFAVLFPAPIDGACGIALEGLEPDGADLAPDQAYAVDCTLARLAPLALVDHHHTLQTVD